MYLLMMTQTQTQILKQIYIHLCTHKHILDICYIAHACSSTVERVDTKVGKSVIVEM